MTRDDIKGAVYFATIVSTVLIIGTPLAALTIGAVMWAVGWALYFISTWGWAPPV